MEEKIFVDTESEQELKLATWYEGIAAYLTVEVNYDCVAFYQREIMMDGEHEIRNEFVISEKMMGIIAAWYLTRGVNRNG